MEELPTDIIWNKFLNSLMEMIEARDVFIKTENDFKSGCKNSSFESIKIKRNNFEKAKALFKENFDKYIVELINDKGKDAIMSTFSLTLKRM